jgi:uncharacterized MAPEG superfamily protein
LRVTSDLTLLVWAVALAFVQIMVASVGTAMKVGMAPLAGNRVNVPTPEGWPARAQRAYRNMLETLPLFAALVLTAHVAGLANAMVVIGAQLYFWARLAYAVVYVVGIPWLRTLVWAVSVLGLVVIFFQLV